MLPAPPPLSSPRPSRRSEIISERFCGYDLIRFDEVFRDHERLRRLRTNEETAARPALLQNLSVYPAYVLRFGVYTETRDTWVADLEIRQCRMWHDIAAVELRWHLSTSGALDSLPTLVGARADIVALHAVPDAVAAIAAAIEEHASDNRPLQPAVVARCLDKLGFRDIREIDTRTLIVDDWADEETPMIGR
jgi:hypothetical protein